MTQLILKVNPEYEKLVPPLTTAEYNALKESIKTEGQQLPIIINQDFEILDGHHRNKACLELDIEPDFEVKHFEDKLSEKLFVIDANLERRQLNKFQEIELRKVKAVVLSEKAKQKLSEKAKQQQNSFGIFRKVEDTDSSQVIQDGIVKDKIDSLGFIAKDAKVGRATVAKVNKILEKAPDKIKQECREGKRTINSAYAIVREQERQEQRNDELSETTANLPEDLSVYIDDFSNANIEANSVQLILTDPPYPSEYLPEWEKLGEFANKVLVPGGYLIAYCGHYSLPQVLDSLRKHLEYFWIIALTQNKHSLVHSRHVFCDWKPLLIFYKPPLTLPDYFGDVINGKGMEKEHHDWQQGLPELEGLITNFCPKNGLILDPFAGSGTTLIAAKKLGRKAIGIEIDPQTASKMIKRIMEETTNGSN